MSDFSPPLLERPQTIPDNTKSRSSHAHTGRPGTEFTFSGVDTAFNNRKSDASSASLFITADLKSIVSFLYRLENLFTRATKILSSRGFILIGNGPKWQVHAPGLNAICLPTFDM